MKLSDLSLFDSILENDAEFNILGMATSEFSFGKKVLSFLSDEKFLHSILENTSIKAIITTQEIFEKNNTLRNKGVLISKNPKKTFFEIHNDLVKRNFYWKTFENRIACSAQIHQNAVVEGHSVEIGENSIIEAGVVIKSGTIIGKNVIIRSGAVIGGEGFQFSDFGEDMISVRSGGRVVIEDNVEVQYNSCIDKGVLGGDTILRQHVKIDNLVYIAHDVELMENTAVAAGASIMGRCVVGKRSWIGPNSVISNGIKIGNKSRISLGAVVTKNVPENQTVSGNFAINHEKFISFLKSIR